jgi:threonine dehydrogenase-like Zn-dependent dehydrogenase
MEFVRQADSDQDGIPRTSRSGSGDVMPHLLDDGDPLGAEDLATHRLPLDQAPHGYDMFQKKQDDAIKVLLEP